jgi:hypothetical protein
MRLSKSSQAYAHNSSRAKIYFLLVLFLDTPMILFFYSHLLSWHNTRICKVLKIIEEGEDMSDRCVEPAHDRERI